MAKKAGTNRRTAKQAKDEPKWTVMVFMGADNLPEEDDLTGEAQNDLKEMRAAMKLPPEKDSQRPSAPSASNVLVQLHGKGTVTREHIDSTGKSTYWPVPPDEQDATSGKALAAFIKWALATANHGKDDYSMLVLWGHSYRFAIGHAATRAGVDALDFAELAGVLKRLQEDYQKAYGLTSAPKLDIVGFDACDLATIEMACQLHPFADYLLASQIAIPLPGWPYDRILDRIKNPKGRLMGPAEFGTYIVRRFCEAYQAPLDGFERDPVEGDEQMRTVSLTLLDLRRAPELDQLTETLARKLIIALDSNPDDMDVILELFIRSQTIDDKPFVDVADLCLNLLRFCGDPAVSLAAQRLGDFVLSPEPVVEEESENGFGKPFVVEHGRNACKAARLHGLSLYAPHVSSTHDVEAAAHFYEKFVFVKRTLWSDLVHALAEPK